MRGERGERGECDAMTPGQRSEFGLRLSLSAGGEGTLVRRYGRVEAPRGACSWTVGGTAVGSASHLKVIRAHASTSAAMSALCSMSSCALAV